MATSATAAVAAGTFAQVVFNDPSISIIVAGMAGGAVRWHYKKEAWRVGLGSVFVGGICAKYLGPLSIDIIEKVLTVEINDSGGNMGAFLMGLGGVAIIGLILDGVERRGKSEGSGK